MPRSSRHRAREKKWANPSARKHSFSTVRERAFWTIFTENSKIPQKSRCSALWDPPDTPQTKKWAGWDRTTFGHESPRHAAFTITLHSTRIDIRGGGIPIPRPMLRSPKPSVPRGLAFSGLQGRHMGALKKGAYKSASSAVFFTRAEAGPFGSKKGASGPLGAILRFPRRHSALSGIA